MIDYKASAKLHNTTVDKLKAWFKKYPGSGKTIVAICDIGGEVRHHIAYDFLRPKTLRVRITRKFHSQIHSPKGLPVTERGYSLID